MQEENYRIEDSGTSLLPRENLLLYGSEKLSNQELLAILLRTGTRQLDVVGLAGKLLKKFGDLSSFRTASIRELCEVAGIGKVKAIELKAMMEFGKRIQAATRPVGAEVLSSETMAEKMSAEMADFTQEHLVVIYLDNRHRIIEKRTVFIGTVNSAPAVPREILYYAVKNLATAMLVVHNHPSGLTEPSQADIFFTDNLAEACQMVGIELVDHLIVGQGSYYSFREEKEL